MLLLDSASLYFRAFFGVPEVIGPSGVPTNAVRGLLDMIASLVERGRPTHLVACWDNDWRPAFRVEAIPSYKAHRVAEPGPDELAGETVPEALGVQVPIIVDALTALGIARVGVDGYEADDVIGTLATAFSGRMPVDIVTGDRDLFQLVDDAREVRVLYVARGVGKHERVTEQVVREKYDVEARQYADFATLRGDASDGLPGVSGVGDKTAAVLMRRFGDMAGLLTAVEDPTSDLAPGPRRKLRDAWDYLAVAPTVVKVACDIDLGDPDLALPRTPKDPDALVALAQRWGLDSPMGRLVETLTDLP